MEEVRVSHVGGVWVEGVKQGGHVGRSYLFLVIGEESREEMAWPTREWVTKDYYRILNLETGDVTRVRRVAIDEEYDNKSIVWTRFT